ncbi:MAG: cysteine--tRNA ligase, partial [Actinomycetota bacterium]|nr:cysteine--tRNA ligase [Actinomycetota bacterium]
GAGAGAGDDGVLSAVRAALDDDLDTPSALAAVDRAAASGRVVSAAAALLGVV